MDKFSSFPPILLYIIYGFAAVSLLWLASKYKSNQVALLIILLFSSGFFAYLGKNVGNAYKIVTLIYSGYLFLNGNVFVRLNNRINIVLLIFVMFLISFVISSLFVNDDGIFLTFAQLNRFIIPVILFFVIRKKAIRNPDSLYVLNKLFFQLLFLQIIITIIKYVLFGKPVETLVGSISFTGGAAGTSIPLMALLWFGVNTNLNKLEWKHWLFLAGLLFIGFASGKRAVWLIFPLVFLIYGLYVAKKKYPKQYMRLLFLAPIFFYFGLRLSPTLNPENKIWGSFDVEYAYNYATDYSLGKENKSGDRGVGKGRGGANLLLWEMITTQEFTNKLLFGNGSKRIYAADKSKYRDSDFYFGVNHKGSITGVFALYIAIGLVGVLMFLAYYLLMFFEVKYTRLSIIFIIVAVFDFVFYVGTIAREPALSVLFVFLIIFSNYQYSKSGKFLNENVIDISWKGFKNFKKARKYYIE